VTWQDIFNTILALIGCVGGAGIIIVAIVKFTSDKIAERLLKKYELKLNKELESFKSKLDNKLYVSKTRFDAEFNIYRQLSESTVLMVKEVSQLFPSFTRDSRTDINTYKEKYGLALDKVVIAQDLLSANAPFISKEVYDKFSELEKKCKDQLYAFTDFRLRPDAKEYIEECRDDYKGAYKKTAEINNDLNSLLEDLRTYLLSLDVM